MNRPIELEELDLSKIDAIAKTCEVAYSHGGTTCVDELLSAIGFGPCDDHDGGGTYARCDPCDHDDAPTLNGDCLYCGSPTEPKGPQ